MSKNDPHSVDAELEALRKRSAELIAEVCRINQRIDALAAKAKPSPASPANSPNAGPGIADTWVEENGTDGSGPATRP